jgi:hypothetical protein
MTYDVWAKIVLLFFAFIYFEIIHKFSLNLPQLATTFRADKSSSILIMV